MLLEHSNMLHISLQLASGRNLELSLPLALDVSNSTIQISREEGYLKILLPFYYLLAGSQLAVDERGDTSTGITAASMKKNYAFTDSTYIQR